jgi:O-antigen/teichoic acid export membrane protein
VARNISTRYVSILADMGIGLALLPFNLAHLGKSEYGLWILLGSVTMHFSAFEMGTNALVKFMAQYRAKNDARAINEIGSTVFFTFSVVGLIVYAALTALAFNLEHLFHLTPAQAGVGQWILMIIGLHVMVNFPFGVYGAVTSGFQRYDINNMVAVVTSVAAAAVNVAVVLAGYDIVYLVAATTAVRMSAYLMYRYNAHKVFPELHIRPSLFRMSRLKEVMGFSAYMSVIDWANRLNYQIDEVVIGAFLGPVAVAVWAPAERIVSGVQRLTNQVNGVLFPLIVDSDTINQQQRLRQILLEGTRLSLAMVVPIAAAIFVLADPLITAWLGSGAEAVSGAVPVLQILSIAVAIRVGDATSTTLLKGSGSHRLVAGVNLAAGLVNVALSALLIGRFGLIGVAYGTLIPIGFAAVFILFPAACRRVGVPVMQAFMHAVVPAVWPAVIAGIFLFFIRGNVPSTLLGVLLESAAAGIVYLVLFIGVAISSRDRVFYFEKAKQVFARTPKATGTPAAPAVVRGQ